MSSPELTAPLEAQIERWRSYLARRRAVHAVDVAELEDHLREQIGALTTAGLSTDEAFLVAVKRMGELDGLSREFAREHSERLWKQLVLTSSDGGAPARDVRRDGIVAFALAVVAAMLVKMPGLFGASMDSDEGFYAQNAPFFVFPLLTGFFVWKRGLATRTVRWLIAGFVIAGFVANLYPLAPGGHVMALAILHLPIALWLLVGVAYAGGRWAQTAGRMDFVRFTGELFIYYVLIALGGGVLTGFTAMIFEAAGLKIEWFFQQWLVPCGAAGAVIVAAWLVEAKQSVIENMAPVLARIFTPLFTAVILVFLGTLVVTGRGVDIARNVLIAFDILLVLVLGLLLYSVSARDTEAPPGPFDALQITLLVLALVADAIALQAIVGRIGEFGFTPNRVAALGENVVLLVNLAWSAVLYVRFVRGRGSFAALEQWQTRYLPVYAIWAAFVVAGFPLIFGYQ
ncbi:MAG: permease prefix domain 1-containing protein [Gemmatimonadaceae bacterium]|nr:permease prefix domain 1-containing protein [Gemmatimonadaceae bacterium]